MDRKDSNKAGRDLLKRDLGELVGGKPTNSLSDIVGANRDQSLSFEQHEHSPTLSNREHHEYQAHDFHAFSRIVIANATTPLQLKEATSAAGARGRGFSKDLAELIETLAASLNKEPLVKMFVELRDIGLDKLIASEEDATTHSYEVASRAWREFANAIDSVSLRELFHLPEEVRTLLVNAAHLSAEALCKSDSFKNDLMALSESQPPKALIHTDLHAQAVASKILSTLCVVWSQTLEHALKNALDLDKSGQYVQITGLIGHISPSLMVISANTLLGKIVSDFHLQEQVRRLGQVCAAVKSPGSFAHSKVFKMQGVAFASHITQQALRILPTLRAAIALRQTEDALVEMSRFAATIPDDRILPLDQREKMFKYENKLVLKLSQHTTPYDFHCAVGPHTCDLELITIPSNPATHQKPNNICVAPNGEITLPEILNLMPVTADDFRRMFPETSELHSMNETAKRIAGHALFVLNSMEDAAPTLLCRVQELPKFMGIEWLDESLVLTVLSMHLGDFLNLFKYDQAIYNKLAEATRYNPAQKLANPLHPLCFSMGSSKSAATAAEQELDSEMNGIEVIANQEVVLRREVSKLLRDNVKTFADLLPILTRHFDVQEIPRGRSPHRELARYDHRPFALAPKYEEPSAPLHIPITNKLLDCLRIPRDELKKILEQM
ncbi:MAG: hypothetical protein ACK5GN_10355 [Pseudomonadota bacterium]|jgi:hypothetical protein